MQAKRISLLTLTLTFSLFLAGAVIHNTGSGLSCPDWPLCGSFGTQTFLAEVRFSIGHRLLVCFVFFCTVLLMIATYKKRNLNEESHRTFVLSVQALIFVVFQALVGYITIKYKLPSTVSTGHFVLSLLFFSTLVFLHHRLAYLDNSSIWERVEERVSQFKAFPHLRDGVNILIGFWILQMLAGGFLRYSGAGLACGLADGLTLKCADPLAEGGLVWPSSLASQLNWIHRFMGGLLVLLGFFHLPRVSLLAYKLRGTPRRLKRYLVFLPVVTLFLFLTQLIMGLITIKSGLKVIPTTAHFALALAVLGMLWKISFYIGDLEKAILGKQAQTRLRDFIELTKPRLGLLVMLTAVVGLMTTTGMGVFKSIWGLSLIAMVVMGAASLNCYLEKDVDALMERTKNRALPADRLSPQSAFGFGFLLLGLSLPLLYVTINPLTAFLAAMAAILYLLAYTPLKQMSPLAVYIGALPGAIPSILGRTMVLGKMDIMAWALFAILFVWQIPHFLAISVYHAQDYRKASILVYGNTWSFRRVAGATVFFTLVLGVVSFWPVKLGQVTSDYSLFAWLLNFAFLALSLGSFVIGDNIKQQRQWARAYFIGSIFYLPLLLCAMILLKSP